MVNKFSYLQKKQIKIYEVTIFMYTNIEVHIIMYSIYYNLAYYNNYNIYYIKIILVNKIITYYI